MMFSYSKNQNSYMDFWVVFWVLERGVSKGRIFGI